MKRKSIFYFFSLIYLLSILLLGGCSQDNSRSNSDEFSMISAEKAQEFALTHAGLTENQATFIRSERDMDDGKLKYDVEFYTDDGLEYDYEIDPYTGKVLSFDLDAIG